MKGWVFEQKQYTGGQGGGGGSAEVFVNEGVGYVRLGVRWLQAQKRRQLQSELAPHQLTTQINDY